MKNTTSAACTDRNFKSASRSCRAAVEPDLLFVSNARSGQLRKNHLEGPPDMLVEIVSPESVDRDWNEKPAEYEAAGVPEYWIVDPMTQRAEVYVLSATGKVRSRAGARWLARFRRRCPVFG